MLYPRPCLGSPQTRGLRVERGAPAQPLISHVVFCSFQSMGICFIGKRNFENFILEVSVL